MQSLTQRNSSHSVSSIKNILEDSSLTFAEKAISIKSLTLKNKQGEVSKPSMAGDIAIVDVDLAMAQDSTGPLAIRSLNEMRVNKLFNPSRVLLVIDHTFPAADEKVANLHAMMRGFASKHSCMLVEGSISHQHILEYLAVPGMMILGADSHTCQAGCISAFATGIGSTEIAAVWATGQMWLRVPETIKIKLSGNFSKGVSARDLILDYIGKVGEDGANYKALEWTYANDITRKEFSIDSRACISNASMECGAKISVFPTDELTRTYLNEKPRIIKDVPEIDIQPGSSANYVEEIEIECDNIEPMVAGPDHPDLVHSVEEIGGMEIDQAFIGSSTNGRIEDLEIAARILKGRKVHKNTRCVVTPASVKVYEEAIKRGYVEIYLESGAVFTNATCGACVGTHLGALGESEICLSSSSRNFVGRMGALSSKVYLASPATVAASAIEGKIIDPRRFL
ncbi:MAG TPA: aconitase/3-isopropylmalate dehydratase large subunit family protein [Nitrososphaeraceae archaeon]|jgi:3-isopropylmalate/(R)-2-methylmalate dehydratase large subunit|nr:aconitase/3-isopropylmalate dehydratase large subunit family protein [Nitrososphaeraceae archaeon]